MKSRAVADLSSVIRQNTRRQSLEELAAKGKRHFRVVSGEKVMRLLQAVVDDAIHREAGELVRDRDRIVRETRQEFDRVLRIQTEQDAVIRRHLERADYFRRQAEEAEERVSAMQAELARTRERTGQRETELNAEFECERLELRSEYERKLEESRAEHEKATARLRKVEQRLSNARETIEGYDREFERLNRALEAERARPTAKVADPDLSRARLAELEDEVRALTGQLASTRDALVRAQRELTERAAREADGTEIRAELSELRELIADLASRPAAVDASAIGAIVERLSERDRKSTEELENRFRENMEKTLAEVTRALHAATAKPVDVAVEATDVLIERLFDHEDEMGTNLDVLAVEERESVGQDVANSLARLREARQLVGRSEEEDT